MSSRRVALSVRVCSRRAEHDRAGVPRGSPDWSLPSTANIGTQPLAKVPAITSNSPIEHLGATLSAPPLPAIVFTDRKPQDGVIRVDDTATALGFDQPMFLAIAGCQQAPDDTVILTGYFHIPVPDIATGDLWSHVLQNSIRAGSSVTIFRSEGQLAIDFAWDEPMKQGRSWFHRF